MFNISEGIEALESNPKERSVVRAAYFGSSFNSPETGLKLKGSEAVAKALPEEAPYSLKTAVLGALGICGFISSGGILVVLLTSFLP